MHKLTADRMKWGQAAALGGVLLACLMAGVLRYDGVERVSITRKGVTIGRLRVLSPNESLTTPPGYFADGFTAWGTPWGRGCQYYHRGSVEVEECYDYYAWR